MMRDCMCTTWCSSRPLIAAFALGRDRCCISIAACAVDRLPEVISGDLLLNRNGIHESNRQQQAAKAVVSFFQHAQSSAWFVCGQHGMAEDCIPDKYAAMYKHDTMLYGTGHMLKFLHTLHEGNFACRQAARA